MTLDPMKALVKATAYLRANDIPQPKVLYADSEEHAAKLRLWFPGVEVKLAAMMPRTDTAKQED